MKTRKVVAVMPNDGPDSHLPLERAVEDGGKQSVQLGGSLRLQPLQPIHLRLQRIQLGDDPALLGDDRP